MSVACSFSSLFLSFGGTIIHTEVSHKHQQQLLIFCSFVIFMGIKTGTQALVRPGSPNSSISADDRSLHQPVAICKARAVADSTGSGYPYEREALRFKVSLSSTTFPNN